MNPFFYFFFFFFNDTATTEIYTTVHTLSLHDALPIRRSHQSASSSPPARHQPEIAAMVGFDGVRRVNPIGPAGSPSRGAKLSIALRSAPAQNATSPAPVRISTRAPSSASKRS